MVGGETLGNATLKKIVLEHNFSWRVQLFGGISENDESLSLGLQNLYVNSYYYY
jgi:hypothetical protein